MATVRMTGLISGMDTESIIKELVNAQKLKNKKTTDKLTVSEWKEDKWKELNTKLNKLYTGELSTLRLQGGYSTKTATSSNTDIVTVTSSATASTGAHTLSISQLASPQNITGAKIEKDKKGKEVTISTKLSDLGMDEGSVIKVTGSKGTKTLTVTDKTTLDSFISTCTSAGLNASFDNNQKRLFISSAESGSKNSFTITTNAPSYTDISNLVGYGGLDANAKQEISNALAVIKDISSAELDTLYDKVLTGDEADEDPKKIEAVKILQNYAIKKAEADTKKECIDTVKEEKVKSNLLAEYSGNDDEKKIKAIKAEILTQVQEQIAAGKLKLNDTETPESYTEGLYTNYSESDREVIFSLAINRKYANGTNPETGYTYVDEAKEAYTTIIESVEFKNNVLSTGVTDGLYSKMSDYVNEKTGVISGLGLGEITGETVNGDMVVIAAADAKIILDGAELTGTTNSIVVNGLTINLKTKTETGKTITLDVTNDTQATYDKIKKLIKSYNEILDEMNDLYYANTAKGYAPLTDDEKEAMTESQIEKWEKKIKDSILRRDNTLDTVITSIKSAMMSSVSISGKNYSLSNFGIQTSTDYTEKGLLHIYGDKEDTTYGDKDDKLYKALTEDPATTIEALSGIFSKVYSAMNEKMSSIPNVRSKFSFYNDKLVDNEQTAYKKKIAVLEKKLTEMENSYYKKFSAMETAMAKMQSQSNALSGLLGNTSK